MLSKDKKMMIYSTAKFIMSSWICSRTELQKLKHGFRQPAFWQYHVSSRAFLSHFIPAFLVKIILFLLFLYEACPFRWSSAYAGCYLQKSSSPSHSLHNIRYWGLARCESCQ